MPDTRKSLLVFFIAIGWLATGVDGSSMLHRNVAQLTALSEHILVGRVISVSDGIENQIPYTEITVEISEALKGTQSGKFTFRQFGLQNPRTMPDGRVNLNLTPQGWPKFHQGEDVVLFLYKAASMTGLRTTVGLFQGKFDIVGGELSNAIDNAGLFNDVSVSTATMTLAERNLLTINRGPVDAAAFISFVRKSVSNGWFD